MAPQVPARQTVWTANRILMLVAAVLFALASLSLAFGWSVNPWTLGFGGFAATCLSWCI